MNWKKPSGAKESPRAAAVSARDQSVSSREETREGGLEKVKVVTCWSCGRPARSDIVAGRWWCSWCGGFANEVQPLARPTGLSRTPKKATSENLHEKMASLVRRGWLAGKCQFRLAAFKTLGILTRVALLPPIVKLAAAARKILRIITRLAFLSPMVFLLGVLLVSVDSLAIRDQIRLTGVFEPGGFVAIVTDDRSVKGFYKADVELKPVTAEAQSVWNGLRLADGDEWGSSISGDLSYPGVYRIPMALMASIPERSELRNAKVDIRIRGSVVTPRSLAASAFENRTVTLDDIVTLPIGFSPASGLRVLLAKCWVWWRCQLPYWFFFFLFALNLAALPSMVPMFHDKTCTCKSCFDMRVRKRQR